MSKSHTISQTKVILRVNLDFSQYRELRLCRVAAENRLRFKNIRNYQKYVMVSVFQLKAFPKNFYFHFRAFFKKSSRGEVIHGIFARKFFLKKVLGNIMKNTHHKGFLIIPDILESQLIFCGHAANAYFAILRKIQIYLENYFQIPSAIALIYSLRELSA